MDDRRDPESTDTNGPPSGRLRDALKLQNREAYRDAILDAAERLCAHGSCHEAKMTDIAEIVSGSGVGSTTATAFSSELLLTVDPLSDELLRLFVLAGGTIAIILATVYWIRPKERNNRIAAFRRTFADLGLTLAAIGMSINLLLSFMVSMSKSHNVLDCSGCWNMFLSRASRFCSPRYAILSPP